MNYNFLADIVGTNGVDAFIKDVWGSAVQKYRYSGATMTAEIMNLAMFELMLTRLNRAHEGWLHFASGSIKQIPLSMIDKDGLLNMEMIRGAFVSGETLYLTKAERLFPTLQCMCHAIEKDFLACGISLREAVNAHIFLTPPKSQAFQTHRDEHASFILQIEGVKEWTVYESLIEQPAVKTKLVKGVVDRATLADFRQHKFLLEPGDVLYMPEWWPHEAYASDAHSMHITFRVFPLRWADIITEVSTAYSGLSDSVPCCPIVEANHLVDSLINKLTSPSFVKLLRNMLNEKLEGNRRYKKLHVNGFQQILESDNVKFDTFLLKQEDTICELIEMENEVGIKFSNGMIRGAVCLKGLFEYVISKHRMRACDLPQVVGNDELLDIVRSLVRFGLLKVEG
jgi:hypothetical protein